MLIELMAAADIVSLLSHALIDQENQDKVAPKKFSFFDEIQKKEKQENESGD